MAHAEDLAQRIRQVMDGREGVTEGTMFGGPAWLVNGNMACGTVDDNLLVRVDRYDRDRILEQPNVQPMHRNGRLMRGFVSVESAALADPAELARWIEVGASYAAWLPPK